MQFQSRMGSKKRANSCITPVLAVITAVGLFLATATYSRGSWWRVIGVLGYQCSLATGLVAIGNHYRATSLFGKGSDGSLALHAYLLLWPYMLAYRGLIYLHRYARKYEPVSSRVAPGFFLSGWVDDERHLNDAGCMGTSVAVVDLTCELPRLMLSTTPITSACPSGASDSDSSRSSTPTASPAAGSKPVPFKVEAAPTAAVAGAPVVPLGSLSLNTNDNASDAAFPTTPTKANRIYHPDSALSTGHGAKSPIHTYYTLPSPPPCAPVHYLCVPTFDRLCPSPTSLRAAVDWALAHHSSGKDVVIHCAFGHGRSATVLLACLLAAGVANTPEEGEAMMRKLRPHVELTPDQKIGIEGWCRDELPRYQRARAVSLAEEAAASAAAAEGGERVIKAKRVL